MFNTNESISTFIPYSENSMLAITDENVYKICALNKTLEKFYKKIRDWR